MPGAGSPRTEGAADGAIDTEPAVDEVFDGFEEDSPEEIIAMADGDDEQSAEGGFDAEVAEHFVVEDELVPSGEVPAGEGDAGPAELADRDADVLFGG